MAHSLSVGRDEPCLPLDPGSAAITHHSESDAYFGESLTDRSDSD